IRHDGGAGRVDHRVRRTPRCRRSPTARLRGPGLRPARSPAPLRRDAARGGGVRAAPAGFDSGRHCTAPRPFLDLGRAASAAAPPRRPAGSMTMARRDDRRYFRCEGCGDLTWCRRLATGVWECGGCVDHDLEKFVEHDRTERRIRAQLEETSMDTGPITMAERVKAVARRRGYTDADLADICKQHEVQTLALFRSRRKLTVNVRDRVFRQPSR